MSYLNTKKLFFNKFIRRSILLSVGLGISILLGHAVLSTYAATDASSYSPGGTTWVFTWEVGNVVQLQAKYGSTSYTMDFGGATADPALGGVDLYLSSCDSACLTIIQPLFTNGLIYSNAAATVPGEIYINGNDGAANMNILFNPTVPIARSIPQWTSHAISVGNTTLSAGGPTWYSADGSSTIDTQAEATTEGSHLQYISPTEIADTSTKTTVYYYSFQDQSTATAEGEYSSTGSRNRYINDGYTYYWPISSGSSSNNIVPSQPIKDTTDCAGGIVAETDSNTPYAQIFLAPAVNFPLHSTACEFGTPTDGYTAVYTPNTDFIQAPDPLPGQSSYYFPLAEKLGSINMEYAMFKWVDPNTIANLNDPSNTLFGLSSAINTTATTNATYNADYTRATTKLGLSSNTQIFSTTSCMNSGNPYFPFISVNYNSAPGLGDLSTTNTKGNFYYPNSADSGWTQGWNNNTSTKTPGLNCLFTDIPINNTMNGATGIPYTYIAYPSLSVCPTAAACEAAGGGPGSQTPGNTDTCFDNETGHTYECGGGSTPQGNANSVDPVVKLSGKDYVLSNPPETILGYGFASGDCYAAELLPPGVGTYSNDYAWVDEGLLTSSACSATDYLMTTAKSNDPLLALPPLGSGTADLSAPNPNHCGDPGTNCLVTSYIDPFIRFLTVAVSLVVIISVASGGIQYSTSRDNPEAVKAARKRIFNALIGLVCFFLLYAFLNFIVPGGI